MCCGQMMGGGIVGPMWGMWPMLFMGLGGLLFVIVVLTALSVAIYLVAHRLRRDER